MDDPMERQIDDKGEKEDSSLLHCPQRSERGWSD